MTKLDELKLQLEAATELAQKKWEPVKAMQDQLKEKWTTLFKTLSTCSLKINARINFNYGDDVYIEVGLLDEKDETIFGTDISLHISRPWSSRAKKEEENNRTLTYNVGTCGAFDKTNIGERNKYLMMGILCENFEMIEEVLNEDLDKYKPLNDDYNKASNLEDKAAREVKDEEERIAKEEFLKTFDKTLIYTPQGDYNTYYWKRNNSDDYSYIMFEKETENYQYLSLGNIYNGQFRWCKTKRVNKGTLERWVRANILGKYIPKENEDRW